MAAFIKYASIIGAGPFMVILTEVLGSAKSNPEYSFLRSSRQQMETPALPIFPYISGLLPGSFPYNVTESKAVDSLFAGIPSLTR